MSEPTYDGFGLGWITDASDPRLEILWPAAINIDEGVEFPLYCARIQCEAFAPAIPDGQEAPENYVAAQVLQARALVRAGIAGSGDQIGGPGQETVTVYPMDWTVKQLLRPRKGRPIVR